MQLAPLLPFWGEVTACWTVTPELKYGIHKLFTKSSKSARIISVCFGRLGRPQWNLLKAALLLLSLEDRIRIKTQGAVVALHGMFLGRISMETGTPVEA